MGVENTCAEYNAHLPEWKLVRDAIGGESLIKLNGTLYLPKPSGMDEPEWKTYLERAHFFGAAGRTAEGLHGMIFQKPPVLSEGCPEALKTILEDIDRQGTNLDQFASDLTWDSLPTNWGGVLVDYPQTEQGIDKGTAEKLGLRTYAAWYSAESITFWRYTTIGNQKVLSLVILRESYEKPVSGDEFQFEMKKKYRVLDLDENGEYRQRIYDEAISLTAPSSTVWPMKQGKQINYLPFFTFPGRYPEKSMLFDLAAENIGHFQKTADYENGLHLTGIPTPYAAGLQGPPTDPTTGKEVPIKLGGNSFLFIPDAQGKAAYLEFTGQGLSEILKALSACEERMAILGARIISAEKKGVETAETARIHRAGENSVLASFSLNASDVLTKVIREIAEWEGIAGCENVTYLLNTDYDVSEMSAQDLSALATLWVQGGITNSILFYNLKKGERTPPEMDLEAYEDELSREPDHSGGVNGDSPRSSRTVPETKEQKVTK